MHPPDTYSPLNRPLVGVPVKSFGVAKERLSGHLTSAQRRKLGQGLAARTVETISAAGIRVVVIAADQAVEDWAHHAGFDVLRQVRTGLNGASRDLVDAADGPWGIVFADLPLLTTDDVIAVIEAMQGRPVISPSRDGGTNAMLGVGHRVDFAYGPGSFHRHMVRLARDHPIVTVRTGLALDLDTPDDLFHARRNSPWLNDLLSAT